LTYLHNAARAYLEAAGYAVKRETPGFLDMVRAEQGKGHRAQVLVWSDDALLAASADLTPAQRSARDEREQALLGAFSAELASAREATGYYLTKRRLGFSQSFITNATKTMAPSGGIRVPVEFFDAAYKADEGTGARARSVLGDVLKRAARVRRVAQPFFVRRSLDADDKTLGSGDLVEYLETAFMDPGSGPRLRFIDGSAGAGKTVAFNALLTSMFEEFKAAKNEKTERRRPIVFLPEHIRGEAVGYVDDIIDAAAETDMAHAVEPEQCRWLLKNGFSVWMFDGLDEFYAGDNDFFSFLEEELADKGSRAQFLVCTRDSLLTSNQAMRGFIERQLTVGGPVEIYELAPWDASSWGHMAWLELENGRSGKENSARVREFVSAIERSAALSSLACLPFYCAVLLDRFKAQKGMAKDEFELLEFIVERMVEREHGKEIFRWQDFVDAQMLSDALEEEAAELRIAVPDSATTQAVVANVLNKQGRETLLELIECLAHGYRRNPGDASGFGVEHLRDFYGPTYASSDLDEDSARRLQTVLVQFAFFGPGRLAGSLDFTHDILADYMASRHAVGLLRREAERHVKRTAAGQRAILSDLQRQTSAFRQAIGTAEFAAGSLFHRSLAREIGRDPMLRTLMSALGSRGDMGRENVNRAIALLAT